jgi:hypothetical protein
MSQIPIHRNLLDLVIVTGKNDTFFHGANSLCRTFSTSVLIHMQPAKRRSGPCSVEGRRETRVSDCDWSTVISCPRGQVGGRYLVERNVVLDVERFFFGFGVIPGDVLDGFAVDGGVIVRGGSERGMSRLAYQVMVGLD